MTFTNSWRLKVGREQVGYVCADLNEFVKQWREDPQMDCYLIKAGSTAVGFFSIDLNSARHSMYLEPTNFLCVLRCFFIDERYQGLGFAGAALGKIEEFLSGTYENLDFCYLTVNFTNSNAIKTYEKAGFKRLRAPYLGGGFGPAHVMLLPIALTV